MAIVFGALYFKIFSRQHHSGGGGKVKVAPVGGKVVVQAISATPRVVVIPGVSEVRDPEA